MHVCAHATLTRDFAFAGLFVICLGIHPLFISPQQCLQVTRSCGLQTVGTMFQVRPYFCSKQSTGVNPVAFWTWGTGQLSRFVCQTEQFAAEAANGAAPSHDHVSVPRHLVFPFCYSVYITSSRSHAHFISLSGLLSLGYSILICISSVLFVVLALAGHIRLELSVRLTLRMTFLVVVVELCCRSTKSSVKCRVVLQRNRHEVAKPNLVQAALVSFSFKRVQCG